MLIDGGRMRSVVCGASSKLGIGLARRARVLESGVTALQIAKKNVKLVCPRCSGRRLVNCSTFSQVILCCVFYQNSPVSFEHP